MRYNVPRQSVFRVWREKVVGEDYQEYYIDLEVFGYLRQAEPDVGYIEDWIEDLYAVDPDGKDFELTDDEREQAWYILLNQEYNDYY